MKTLYDRNNIRKIRNLYRKNITKTYGIVEDDLQRCHIFGIREAKYLEVTLKLDDVTILKNILTSPQNVLLLTKEEHRLFERNQLDFDKIHLKDKQKTLIELNLQIKATKFRKQDEELAKKIYNILSLW